MATATAPPNSQPHPEASANAELLMKETKRGKVYVGELSPEFLRIPAPQPAPQQFNGATQPPQLAYGQQQMLAQQQVAMVTVNKLVITVIEAKLNKSYGMTKMDPYCRIRVGHAIYETPTATSGGKLPYWGKTVASSVSDDLKYIDVEIFDERAFSSDSRIATGKIAISKTLKKGKSEDDWWPLSGKLGEEKEGMIHLQLSWKIEQKPMYPQLMMPQMMMPAPGYVIPPGVQIGAPGMMPPPQPQRPQPPPVTEEDLKQIKEMFPNMENDVIKTVLEASGGNKDAAINSLLSMQCQ